MKHIPPLLPILSHFQVKSLLEAKKQGASEGNLSLDLGKTSQPVVLNARGAFVDQPEASFTLSWDDIQHILENENGCYQILDQSGEIERVQFFSEEMQRAYSLFPTRSAPTMLVSGITMHRIVDCDPWLDTQNKLKAFGSPLLGDVLDTTMGLGYTAIMAAQSASQVTTIEIDPTVLDVCATNPWSRDLFTAPNILRQIGHAWDVIESFSDEAFSAITHDPPMFNMAGELYSLDFYRELFRVLKKKGRLFHYIGNPKSKSGASVTKGVIRRLKEAGFRRISSREKAFGVLATK